MNYKIVVDSCCDLTEELRADSHFQVIPLTLSEAGKGVGGMPENRMPVPGSIHERLRL